MKHVRALLTVALAGLLAGCGGAGHVPGTTTPPPVASTAEQRTPPPPAVPVEIRIPAIDATSTLVALGLNPDDTVAVPPVETPMQAGWYQYGPAPGERGPAVVLGHVNGAGEEGIFARLHELTPGSEVLVARNDGRTAVFTVTGVVQVSKLGFPTDSVYGNTDAAELRLITCGGDFDRKRGSYTDNIIAYATLTGWLR
ncbi:class F sortase [Saccharopolyspora erythraea]|uniref:class F sortase n=1 Tax=Saccharopolyspora erythraea TaxID=1836 RepID=UPI001BA79A38|nr:class F sortase [Saccharopolyspora erythraea]QUH02247.1 class F sortase [Saccharopolyspora erythraea]